MQAQQVVPHDGQLAWIETDGQAYLKTNVNLRTPIASRILCRFNQSAASLEVLMGYGNTSNTNNTMSLLRRYATDELRIAYHVNFSSGVNGSTLVGKDIEAITQMRNGSQLLSVRKVGDTPFLTSSHSNSQGISTSPYFRIFATYESGQPYRICSEGTRIYSIELYSDYDMTTKIEEIVPWRQNGEVGMMEIVGNNFIGNYAGIGAFVGGPNVN